MAETLNISSGGTRAQIYSELAPQIESLIVGEPDAIANFANVAAAIKQALGFFWVGFYRATETDLVLGPFQGPIACTHIAFGKGVCGHAYSTAKTVIVPDVEKFPGHIACASESRSEIVVPIFSKSNAVVGVLDVDSDSLNDFSDIDAEGLERIVKILESTITGDTI